MKNAPKRLLAVFGTRPEAIKMCPLALELKSRRSFDLKVCVTAQHREMLDGVLKVFNITPDVDLDLMRPFGAQEEFTSRALLETGRIIREYSPRAVIVHGDTSTAFAAALAAFYAGVPVAHVEAGLRTHDISSPFPEEFNRQAVGLTAALHFAPTKAAQENLLREGKDPQRVFVTGNTVTDALRLTEKMSFESPLPASARGKKLIILTAHRRENLGRPIREIFAAARRAADEREDIFIICPAHKNPEVQSAAKALKNHPRIAVTRPLDTVEFHGILRQSFALLTDSGGIQEEATALGIPTLVLRDATERPEGTEAGTLKLVGNREDRVYAELLRLITDKTQYEKMARAEPIYGNGRASEAIADILERYI